MRRLIALAATMTVLLSGTIALNGSTMAQSTPTSTASLPSNEWKLVSIADSTGTSTDIETPENYTIQFWPNGQVVLKVDCNRGIGGYTVEGNSLTLGNIATTLMLCPEGSHDFLYMAALTKIDSFSISTDNASDHLLLSGSGGTLEFAPSLLNVVWQWQYFQGGDGSETTPSDPAAYTIQFLDDGTVAAQLDCNRGFGPYSVIGDNGISIQVASTRMACPEGTLDAQFAQWVSESTSFVIRNGNLSLALPVDSGINTFAPFVPDAQESTPEAAG